MPYKDPEEQARYNKRYQKKYYIARKAKDPGFYKGRNKKRQQEIARWWQEYKSTVKCTNCPEDHPACLDFHHRYPLDKDTEVSYMVVQGCARERILKEVAKCVVLCSNCHRKLHYEDN